MTLAYPWPHGSDHRIRIASLLAVGATHKQIEQVGIFTAFIDSLLVAAATN